LLRAQKKKQAARARLIFENLMRATRARDGVMENRERRQVQRDLIAAASEHEG
jgi:hypothetical protein